MPSLLLGQITTNLMYLIYWLEVQFAFNCRYFERCRRLISVALLCAYSYCSSDIFALNTPQGKTNGTNAAPLNSVNFYFADICCCCSFLGPKTWLLWFRGHFCYGINDLAFVHGFVCALSAARLSVRRNRMQRICGVDSFYEALPANGQWITFFHSCYCSFRQLQVKKCSQKMLRNFLCIFGYRLLSFIASDHLCATSKRK